MFSRLCKGCLAFALAAVAQSAAADRQSLDTQALRVMQAHDIAGLSIGFILEGRTYHYNYGVASRDDRKPIDSNTLFEIGSLSKVYASALAAYAQRQGKLSLSDHPGRYLPWLKGAQLDQATLLDLATHTAGGLPLQVPDELDAPVQLEQYFQSWVPSHAPGRRRTYSNPGIGLLGMATASSLDMTYRQALEQLLLPRLGLKHTFFDVPESQRSHYAQGYNKASDPIRLQPGLLADEAYGIKSTSADLLRLVAIHLGVTPVEPELAEALAETRSGRYQVGPMTQALVWERYPYPVNTSDLLAGNSLDMVLGTHEVTRLQSPDTSPNVWINKTGSTNGFGGYIAMVPAARKGVVILANKNFPAEARIRLALHALGEPIDQ